MNIYESISKIMEEIPAIGKTKKNVQQGFMFRGIDDVMNALQPLLSKHKVVIGPEVLEQIREERVTSKGGNLIYSICKIKYKFFAEDGTSIEATTIGEGMDSGDKATNKAMAIAMKYALFQVFCIPTEEMKDPDSDTPPESITKIEKEKQEQERLEREAKELAEKVISETKVKALNDAIKNNEISDEALSFVLMKYDYNTTAEIKVKDYMAIANELAQYKK